MATKCFVLLAACLAFCNGAAVRREVAAPSDNPLQELEKHAAEFQKTFPEQFNKIINSKETQDVTKALKEGSDSVMEQISAYSNSLKSWLGDASGTMKEALEQARQNLEGTVEELHKAHPDVEQNATQLRAKVQTAVQKAVQETQKLAKEVSKNVEQNNKELAPKIKAAYDDFVKIAQDVQKKVQDASDKQ